jgi:anti-anti-sigma factor
LKGKHTDMPQEDNSIRVTVDRPDAAQSPRLDAAILKISGELGLESMIGEDGKHSGLGGDTALDRALRNALPTPPAIVVIDLASVPYLASLGMAALLRFQNQLKESGSKMRLAGTTAMVVALLHRCRLDNAFKLFPDVASALKE